MSDDTRLRELVDLLHTRIHYRLERGRLDAAGLEHAAMATLLLADLQARFPAPPEPEP